MPQGTDTQLFEDAKHARVGGRSRMTQARRTQGLKR